MQTEAQPEAFDEFDEDVPQQGPRRSAMEFRGPNGLVLRELVSEDDAEEMLELISSNRDTFAEFAPELNKIQNKLAAIKMVGDRSFSTYGLRTAKNQPLAGIVTVAQERDHTGRDDLVTIGYAVGKDFQRQGIASEAIKTISEKYLEIPQINTVRCYVKPKNDANRRLLRQCGFHEAGGIPHKSVFYDLDKPTS